MSVEDAGAGLEYLFGVLYTSDEFADGGSSICRQSVAARPRLSGARNVKAA